MFRDEPAPFDAPAGSASSRAWARDEYSQDAPNGLAPGRKVRHAQFGLGTVLSVEELDDDMKLVVKFATVGTKTLRAKYAKLEMV